MLKFFSKLLKRSYDKFVTLKLHEDIKKINIEVLLRNLYNVIYSVSVETRKIVSRENLTRTIRALTKHPYDKEISELKRVRDRRAQRHKLKSSLSQKLPLNDHEKIDEIPNFFDLIFKNEKLAGQINQEKLSLMAFELRPYKLKYKNPNVLMSEIEWNAVMEKKQVVDEYELLPYKLQMEPYLTTLSTNKKTQ